MCKYLIYSMYPIDNKAIISFCAQIEQLTVTCHLNKNQDGDIDHYLAISNPGISIRYAGITIIALPVPPALPF